MYVVFFYYLWPNAIPIWCNLQPSSGGLWRVVGQWCLLRKRWSSGVSFGQMHLPSWKPFFWSSSLPKPGNFSVLIKSGRQFPYKGWQWEPEPLRKSEAQEIKYGHPIKAVLSLLYLCFWNFSLAKSRVFPLLLSLNK